MPLSRLAPHTRWTCPAPDVTETRQGRVLLVWGDVPYWTVVDAELAALLGALDGTVSLEALFARHPAWGAARAEVLAALTVLAALSARS